MLGIGAALMRCENRTVPSGISFHRTAVPRIGDVSWSIGRVAPQPETNRFPDEPTAIPSAASKNEWGVGDGGSTLVRQTRCAVASSAWTNPSS
jgi:hypothetical protein